MKILDRYILSSYLKTFFSVFIILMFIFVLQTVWLYIKELAGKDLDLMVIFKFLLYFTPKLIPLVLPLTILVSSLMVFGKFSENYEFAAMKANGISLQRAMRSLTFFIVLIAIITFFFANNVIPTSEYKFLNLRKNMAQLKPAMVIAEGQFSQIGDDFNIKVGKKTGARGQFLKDIIIHKKSPNSIENRTVIIADNGELIGKEGSNLLSLVLNNGNYYEDIIKKTFKERRKRPFIKTYFEEYIINMDLSKFNNVDLNEEQNLSNHKMYNVRELKPKIDTFSIKYNEKVRVFNENMYLRSGFKEFKTNYFQDTTKTTTVEKGNVLTLYKSHNITRILTSASNNVKGTLQLINAKRTEFFNEKRRIYKYEMALNDKYALAIACIILFFVGAPLGAIIRKGGLGLPMIVAIILFLLYHFIGIFAKNSAEDGSLSPFIASWFSTLIMLPLGFWLTYRATTDQGIFDMSSFIETITKPFRKFFNNK